MKIAAIDIGTNSIHMIVVETKPDRTFEVIDREKKMVKLGEGLFSGGVLTQRAFEEGLETVRRYCNLAEKSGCTEILAVATSATREASNGGDFLRAIHKATGVRARVISGKEEGQLIFRAVRHALDLEDENVLVLDIGGGSVETVVGNKESVLLNESLRLGVLRMLERLGEADKLSTKKLDRLKGYMAGVTGEVMEEAHKHAPTRIIGTSGTIRALGEACREMTGGEPWRTVNAQTVSFEDLAKLVNKLTGMKATSRTDFASISPERADNIHLGGMMLLEVMTALSFEKLTLCDASLREGVILDYLDRRGIETPSTAHISELRRRSVVELARKYDRDDPHEQHIAHLALELFDSTRPLHSLENDSRNLLEYAGLLHSIGQQISFKKRHKHSSYIVRHSGLRGLTDREVELVALLVRYHRRARPKKKHKKFKYLSKGDRQAVRVLSGLLRIAVGLDRGQSQVVKGVRARSHEEELTFYLKGRGDLELELWSARRRVDPLARALNKSILVKRSNK